MAFNNEQTPRGAVNSAVQLKVKSKSSIFCLSLYKALEQVL